MLCIDNIYCAYTACSDFVIMAIITEDVPILSIYNILYFILDVIKNGIGANSTINSDLIK